MKYCKGCRADLDDNQFNGDYNYCRTCYNNHKNTGRNISRKEKDTCVYFIKSGDLIKIGFTGDLEERKRNIQVNNPTVVEVLKTMSGGYPEEQQLHQKFAHLNKQGEWFYAAQELLDFIKLIETAYL
jgi:hypothetical protein